MSRTLVFGVNFGIFVRSVYEVFPCSCSYQGILGCSSSIRFVYGWCLRKRYINGSGELVGTILSRPSLAVSYISPVLLKLVASCLVYYSKDTPSAMLLAPALTCVLVEHLTVGSRRSGVPQAHLSSLELFDWRSPNQDSLSKRRRPASVVNTLEPLGGKLSKFSRQNGR